MNRILILLISIGFFNKINGQGCSDAGFCSAGNIKPASNKSESATNGLGFTFGYSIGERGTAIFSPQFEPQIKVSEKSMIQLKIPFVYVSGELGTVQGLGDVILTYNRNLDSLIKKQVSITIGTRIATGTSSLKINDIPMPMPYQISLGTTDIILGAKIMLGKGFSISLGLQQPLVNRNQNGFDSSAYKKLGSEKKLKEEDNFFISASLKRKGDIMLRIDKAFQWTKTSVNLGVLPIYHLGKDKAKTLKGKEIEIEGSQGLTLNINASFYYKLSSKLEISAIAAAPVIVRKSRPDGLTRAFVFLPGLRYYL